MELLVENVQSYPRPPALEPVPQRVRVMLGGAVVVDTTAALRVLETHHAPSYYVPRVDISGDVSPSSGTSFCEWKGRATYWTINAGEVEAKGAAWSYPSPSARFAALRDHLAFYAGRMEACFVGAVQVIPQPGDFYGGWVTPNLTGQIKGAPGTRHW
ncbi:DUF427 domain-containing protein [Tateyamaria armeniaca]|uniref:DUF427 domain-containing protein n=1 Tax=Tateyamaria armeniaca TaxID=2518930 RepID=A0ABW8UQ55_9RHOB